MTTPNTTSHLLAAADGSSSHLHFQIPSISIKLDRDNYSLWKTAFISALETFDLEVFVLNPSPPPATIPHQETSGEKIPNPTFSAWKKKDRFVLLWIKSTLSERAHASVARATSSSMAWTIPDKYYQSQSKGHRMSIKLQLQSLCKGALSMCDYIEKKRAYVDAIAEDLQPVSDDNLMGYILHGLDSSYNPFVTSFMMNSASLQVDDLIGLLFQEEEKIARDLARQSLPHPVTVPDSSTPPPSVNTVSRSSERYNSSHSNGYGSSSGSRSSDSHQDNQSQDNRCRHPHCQLCNKPGHEAIDCWQRGNQVDFPSHRPNPRDQPKQANLAEFNSLSAMDPSWYFDTGATEHASPDLRKLTLADDYVGPDKLQVGNGKPSSTRDR